MKILNQRDIDLIYAKQLYSQHSDIDKFVNNELYQELRSSLLTYLTPYHKGIAPSEFTDHFTLEEEEELNERLSKYNLSLKDYPNWFLFNAIVYEYHFNLHQDIFDRHYEKFLEYCMANVHIYNYAFYESKTNIRLDSNFYGLSSHEYIGHGEEFSVLYPIFCHANRGKLYIYTFEIYFDEENKSWDRVYEHVRGLSDAECQVAEFTVPGALIYFQDLFRKFFMLNTIFHLPKEKLNDFYFDIFMGFLVIESLCYGWVDALYSSSELCLQFLMSSSPYNVFKDAVKFYYGILALQLTKVSNFTSPFCWMGRPFQNKSHLCHLLAISRAAYYVGIVVNYSSNFSEEYTKTNIVTDFKDPTIHAELEKNNILIHCTVWVNDVGMPEIVENFRSSLLVELPNEDPKSYAVVLGLSDYNKLNIPFMPEELKELDFEGLYRNMEYKPNPLFVAKYQPNEYPYANYRQVRFDKTLDDKYNIRSLLILDGYIKKLKL